jgi:hypothetical protein
MHDIAQKQIFFFKLPELDPDPDLVVKFPDPAKRSKSDRIRIRNTGTSYSKFRLMSWCNGLEQYNCSWSADSPMND